MAVVLDEIYASGIGLGEKRRLAARAVATRVAGVPASSMDEGGVVGGFDYVAFLEEVLAAAACACGRPMQRMSPSEAKSVLRRQHGEAGRQLAARIGGVSRLRNAKAHPDAGLLLAIQALRPGDSSAGEPGAAGSVDGEAAAAKAGSSSSSSCSSSRSCSEGCGGNPGGDCGSGRPSMPIAAEFPMDAEDKFPMDAEDTSAAEEDFFPAGRFDGSGPDQAAGPTGDELAMKPAEGKGLLAKAVPCIDEFAKDPAEGKGLLAKAAPQACVDELAMEPAVGKVELAKEAPEIEKLVCKRAPAQVLEEKATAKVRGDELAKEAPEVEKLVCKRAPAQVFEEKATAKVREATKVPAKLGRRAARRAAAAAAAAGAEVPERIEVEKLVCGTASLEEKATAKECTGNYGRRATNYSNKHVICDEMEATATAGATATPVAATEAGARPRWVDLRDEPAPTMVPAKAVLDEFMLFVHGAGRVLELIGDVFEVWPAFMGQGEGESQQQALRRLATTTATMDMDEFLRFMRGAGKIGLALVFEEFMEARLKEGMG